MNIADEKTWLENGLLKGRKVTRCQRKTKAYATVAKDLADANLNNGAYGPCAAQAAWLRGVYRGSDAAGSVYAVLLAGHSRTSHTAVAILESMVAWPGLRNLLYQVLSFRYDGEWNWTAVLLAELK